MARGSFGGLTGKNTRAISMKINVTATVSSSGKTAGSTKASGIEGNSTE